MKAQAPDPVKLFVGVLLADEADLDAVVAVLEQAFGPADYVSGRVAFDCTDYYAPEMGAGISRVFVSHAELIDPGALAEIKLKTNELEDGFCDADANRRVNLDPGYMDVHKLVLASAKYGAPKIYIGRGIYADPTLYYRKGRFHPYDWGFPDFRSGDYNAILMQIRALYKKGMKG